MEFSINIFLRLKSILEFRFLPNKNEKVARLLRQLGKTDGKGDLQFSFGITLEGLYDVDVES